MEQLQPSETPVSVDDAAQPLISSQSSEAGSAGEVVTVDTPSFIVQSSSTEVVDRTETASHDPPADVLALSLPQVAAEEAHTADAPHSALPSLPAAPPPTSTHADTEGLVEGLQKRLKLVEQRFAGGRYVFGGNRS